MDALTEARVRILLLQTRIAKAMGRRRIPGDGDGDGIPYESKKKGAMLAGIASKHLGIDTLKTQNSDAKDFHSVAVWNVKAALDAAFHAGGGKGALPAAETIARSHLGIDSLRTMNSDRADFHDVAVWNVKSALQAAHNVGAGKAKVGGYGHPKFDVNPDFNKLPR